MAIPVILPRQGQSVESCAILGWKKRVGDPVKTGEVLCEVETDKASFEVESPADGTLIAIFHEAGDQVPVLATIAAIGKPGEKTDGLRAGDGGTPASPSSAAPARPAAPVTSTPQPAPAAPRSGKIMVSPRAKALAASNGMPLDGLRGTPASPSSAAPARPAAPVTSTPQPAPADPRSGKVMASPRAKALAASNGMPLDGLRGTGPGGRIIERDVKQALAAGTAPRGPSVPSPAPVPAAPIPPGAVREIKVTGIRKLIADRMLASLSTTAQLTLHSSAEAMVLQEMRARFKESPESIGVRGITINDMVMFAASRALLQHADLNAHFTGDAIRQFADVHLGFATDTPRGLMVPVIRNAHRLSLRALSLEAARLAAACRDSKITPEEMAGGTFTVTNLGGLGVESFTPVLNVPQVAILGVGNIVPRPVSTAHGEMTFVPHIGLSLTINHQAVDGAPGARFLQTLAGLIARFDLLLAQ